MYQGNDFDRFSWASQSLESFASERSMAVDEVSVHCCHELALISGPRSLAVEVQVPVVVNEGNPASRELRHTLCLLKACRTDGNPAGSAELQISSCCCSL